MVLDVRSVKLKAEKDAGNKPTFVALANDV